MHRRILTAAALLLGLGALMIFLAGETDAGSTDTVWASPRVIMEPADGSSDPLLSEQRRNFRAGLLEHSREVEQAIEPLEAAANGSPPTPEAVARAVDVLGRAQRDLPVPPGRERDEMELYYAYVAALRALYWGARDVAVAVQKEDEDRLARGVRWITDGRARLDEVRGEAR